MFNSQRNLTLDK